MDEIDSKILLETNKGLPLTPEPFNEIAAQLGITPREVIARIVKLRESGVIRRFGASIKPNDLGLSANALVAWKVPENRIQEVGSYLSQLSEVTHCYERMIVAGKWEYNLYTVMHAKQRESVEQLVKSLSEATAVQDYQILFSTRDLKRTCTRSAPTATNNVLEESKI